MSVCDVLQLQLLRSLITLCFVVIVVDVVVCSGEEIEVARTSESWSDSS